MNDICDTKGMEVPKLASSCEKSAKNALNEAHYEQLRAYAEAFDSNEAFAIMDILVKRYPQIATNCLNNNYATMKRNIRKVEELLKGES